MTAPRARIAALLLAIGFLVSGLTGAAAAAETQDDRGFVPGPCAVDVPDARLDDVRCGTFTAPERRTVDADPERTVRLPVVVILDDSPDHATDPLVVPISGSVDGSSLGALSYFLEEPAWVGPRDVILVEQRGNLHAEPSLDCPEVDGVLASAQRLDALAACRARLLDEGVDLAAYTSAASAVDLADLRVALGYDTWNLYGAGDGARLAMTVLRDQPAGLRSVILDSTYPPDLDLAAALPAGAQSALDALFADCRADPACRTRYPDLPVRLARALERELAVVIDDPATGARTTVTVDGDAFAGQLLTALRTPGGPRVVPYLIDRVAQGDAGAALPLAQRIAELGSRSSEGRDLSLACAEEAPFSDPALVEQARAASPLAGHVDLADRREAECAVWDVPPADVRESAPVSSAVPALVIAGEYDPAAAWSDLAATGLSRHYSFVVPSTGAAPVWNGGCAASIARAFLDDPAVAPRAGCVDRVPATGFLTTADIDPTAAIFGLEADLRTSPRPGQVGILLATVLVFVGTLAYGVVYAVRRRWDAPAGAVFAAVAAAALNLLFVGVMALVLIRADPLVLEYGLPVAAWPLLLLPFAALACAIVLIVLLIRAWRVDDGGTAHRVILTVSALGTLGFAVWLLTRGLLAL